MDTNTPCFIWQQVPGTLAQCSLSCLAAQAHTLQLCSSFLFLHLHCIGACLLTRKNTDKSWWPGLEAVDALIVLILLKAFAKCS